MPTPPTELDRLIEQNLDQVLTNEQILTQVRSAAYGDLAIEYPDTKRATVDKVVDSLYTLDRDKLRETSWFLRSMWDMVPDTFYPGPDDDTIRLKSPTDVASDKEPV